MLHRFVKKIAVVVLMATVFVSGINPMGFVYVLQEMSKRDGTIVDKIYLATKNKNVVDNFLTGTPKAHAAINPSEREYTVDIGPVNGSAAANYVYASFFNPIGSGRTAVIKRIAIRSNTASSTASNYVNLTVRRTTASSAGTQLASTNIPKKNTGSTDSVLEIRHTGVTVTFAGTVDSRIMGQPQSGAVGAFYSQREIYFGASDEKLIVQPGEGIALYQEAAGTARTKLRILIEWDEVASPPASQGEYLFSFPRVEVTAAANYAYNTFFNPAASGKSAIVKRIWFGAETCDAASIYTNNLSIRRISAASAGTQIASANIPKKHTSSANSVMEFRRTGVTVTQVGGTDARLAMVSPCGAAGQPQGWQQLDFNENDEKLIIQPGEGFGLITDTAGEVDQLVRMIVEWEEVAFASTPASQGEYVWSSSRVESASAVNTTRYSFFNPIGSGKTAVIKRLAIRVNSDAASNYPSFGFRRLTAASAGTLVTATDLPKKHTSSANSIMEMRWCGAACATAITATYAGTADSRLMSVNGSGAIGQTIGQREIVFGLNENIILQPGEGIGFYNDVLASDLDQYVKIQIEWDEEASAPPSEGEYLIDIGPVNGSVAASYTYATFFNPAGSGVVAVIKRVSLRVDAAAVGTYIPIQMRRISAASAGTQIVAANIPKKHTGSSNSAMQIRRTGVTVTYSGTVDSDIMGVQSPGAVASSISGNTGYKEVLFNDSETIVLQPGEGLGVYHDSAADADLRIKVMFEWGEVALGSMPASQGEYMLMTGPVNQSTAANYVYSSFFNPASSAKNYIVKRIGVQINRSGTAVVPTYTQSTVRRVTAASAGTLISTANIPKKHASSSLPTAEIRHTNVTGTFSGVTESRLLGVTTPGVVNQIFGNYETKVIGGDELILQPGEGLALYQELANGDDLVRYRFLFEWDEEDDVAPPQTITFTISTSTIYLGTASPVLTRYASSTNAGGSDTEVEAHSLSISTNATNGYTLTAKGPSLASGSEIIDPIGASNTVPLIGNEQFGIRVIASGGLGAVSSPYAASGFAYNGTATSSTLVASASSGDEIATVYSVRYMTNISPSTPPAIYTTSIIYVATANF